jgi:transcription antitermination factor NusG
MQETGACLLTAAKYQPAPLPYSSGPQLSVNNSNLSWLAVYTKQHHEKRVAEFLVDQRFECYLPLYTAQRKWSNHRTATLQMPLFPTYLFVRTSLDLRIRILRTPGVIGIVGRGSSADAVSDREIEVLRNGLHLRNPEPHEFVVGETVRISAGPLRGIPGTIVICKSSFRVVITVPMIQQSVSVEIAADELEPVESIRACWS